MACSIIERVGNLCRIDVWPQELSDALTYKKMTGKYGSAARMSKSKKMTCTVERVYEVHDDGSGVFPAGMLSRVITFLRSRNIEIQIRDKRDRKALKPIPDFTKIEKLREGQDKLLLAVAMCDEGIIVGGTGAGKSFLIKQICLMYPTLKIVIVSSRIPVIKQIYQDVSNKLAPGAVGIIYGGKNEGSQHRITVVSSNSIMKADLYNCDLLLFDEAHNVGSNNIGQLLGHVQKGRRIGFTASPARGDGTRMAMEAIFGPVIADLPYDEAVSNGLVVPIEVLVYTVGGRVQEKKLRYANLRRGYWRNNIRNQTIADIAKQVPEDDQVLIMVDTLEHACHIRHLLPDYTLVHYGSVSSRIETKRYSALQDSQGGPDSWAELTPTECRDSKLAHLGEFPDFETLEEEVKTPPRDGYYTVKIEDVILGVPVSQYALKPKELDDIKRRFTSGELKHVVATGTWKEGVNFPQLAILIRADGAISEVSSTQIPGRVSRISEGKQVGVLVDFEDTFNDWAAQRSAKRLAFYRRKGWTITRK